LVVECKHAVAVRCRGLQLQLQFSFGVAWLFDLPTDIDPTTDPDTDPDRTAITAPMGLRYSPDGAAIYSSNGTAIQPRWDCDIQPRWDCDTAPMGLRYTAPMGLRYSPDGTAITDPDGTAIQAPIQNPMGLPGGLPISAVPPPSGFHGHKQGSSSSWNWQLKVYNRKRSKF
jgi:hypothetical protein